MKRGTFRKKTYDELLAQAVLKQVDKLEMVKTTRKGSKKALKPTKRKKLSKVSKQPISRLQRALWAECKRIIRSKYIHTCYTCGAINLAGSNLHTGHMLAKASVGAFLKYDLRLLRPQCYLCNVRHGGRGADFIENMRKIEGNEYVDGILNDRKQTVKAYDFYVELIAKYKSIV